MSTWAKRTRFLLILTFCFLLKSSKSTNFLWNIRHMIQRQRNCSTTELHQVMLTLFACFLERRIICHRALASLIAYCFCLLLSRFRKEIFRPCQVISQKLWVDFFLSDHNNVIGEGNDSLLFAERAWKRWNKTKHCDNQSMRARIIRYPYQTFSSAFFSKAG